MSFFTDDEKKDLGERIANFIGVVVDAPDVNAAQQIEDALALAQERVVSGQWTERKAELHLEVVRKAAASTYASARKLKVMETKAAFLNILVGIAGVVNNRIGFPIIPTS